MRRGAISLNIAAVLAALLIVPFFAFGAPGDPVCSKKEPEKKEPEAKTVAHGSAELKAKVGDKSPWTHEQVKMKTDGTFEIESKCGKEGTSGTVRFCFVPPTGGGKEICVDKKKPEKEEDMTGLANDLAATARVGPDQIKRDGQKQLADALKNVPRDRLVETLGDRRVQRDMYGLLMGAGLDQDQAANVIEGMQKPENEQATSDFLRAIAAGDVAAVRNGAEKLDRVIQRESYGTYPRLDTKYLADNAMSTFGDPGKFMGYLPEDVRQDITSKSDYLCGLSEGCAVRTASTGFGLETEVRSWEGRTPGADDAPLPRPTSIADSHPREQHRLMGQALCKSWGCDGDSFARTGIMVQNQECPTASNCRHAPAYTGWHALSTRQFEGSLSDPDPLNKNSGIYRFLETTRETDPEVHNYIQTRLDDARARGIDPRTDLTLSTAAWMGRVGPAATGIQRATENESERGALGMLIQLHPAYTRSILSSDSPERIWDQRLIPSAHNGGVINGTARTAVSNMLGSYRGLARGAQIASTEIPGGSYDNPLVASGPPSFAGRYESLFSGPYQSPGSTYGDFGGFGSAGGMGGLGNIGTLFSSLFGGSGGQGGLFGNLFGASTQSPTTQPPLPPKAPTRGGLAQVAPSMILTANKKEAARGDRVSIIWAATGVRNCALFMEGDPVLGASGKSNAFRFTIPADAPAKISFKLECIPSDARISALPTARLEITIR